MLQLWVLYFTVSKSHEGLIDFYWFEGGDLHLFYHITCVIVFQAFSVFFVCIAITSDMICFFFIPVQWLFFAASTYVWVQYVWHTGNNFTYLQTSLYII